MNNPFDYIPDRACEEAIRDLFSRIDALKHCNHREAQVFYREVESGKMLGVLIAHDAAGKEQRLFAFSGQIGNRGFNIPGFVEPVFDYLEPGGYFKTEESEISELNVAVRKFEEEEVSPKRAEYLRLKEKLNAELDCAKQSYLAAKRERKSIREAGGISDEEEAAMTRRSQFEKAELNRLKKRINAELAPCEEQLKRAGLRLEEMKSERRNRSEALQRWLFDNFRVLNAKGEEKSLSEIFADTSLIIPPSGAGECCAPKLLQRAYKKGLTPVAIAEYWYGKSNDGEVRIHSQYYPACRGKCGPVLGWMLQGLEVFPPLDSDADAMLCYEPEIIFENKWFCVINKPSGMLSVPGKGRALSAQQWLQKRYGPEIEIKMAHRLDRDTSGLLIAAFGPEAYKELQTLFATRKVSKIYIADLIGNYRQMGVPEKGIVSLPISPDYLDRPRQVVDKDGGKPAETSFEFIGCNGDCSRVLFYPHTGRTHQLRVHAASAFGLGMPIIGDALYGRNSGNHGGRLHLHALKIEFIFPLDERHYTFEAECPF